MEIASNCRSGESTEAAVINSYAIKDHLTSSAHSILTGISSSKHSPDKCLLHDSNETCGALDIIIQHQNDESNYNDSSLGSKDVQNEEGVISHDSVDLNPNLHPGKNQYEHQNLIKSATEAKIKCQRELPTNLNMKSLAKKKNSSTSSNPRNQKSNLLSADKMILQLQEPYPEHWKHGSFGQNAQNSLQQGVRHSLQQQVRLGLQQRVRRTLHQ